MSGAPGELGAGIADDGTATATATGRFTAPQVLTASGRITDLVVANQGATLATWTTDAAGNATIHTALRPPGATAFGAPETVAVVPLRYVDPLAPNPDAAFDPGTDRFVVWATDDSTDTAPRTQIPGSARLLLATREAR